MCIKGRWSGWIRVWSGVLQGSVTSVLRPVLFLVFINDLYQGIASDILKFAGDIKIFKEVRDNTDNEALQRDLDNVVLWAQKWQVEFNVKKIDEKSGSGRPRTVPHDDNIDANADLVQSQEDRL